MHKRSKWCCSGGREQYGGSKDSIHGNLNAIHCIDAANNKCHSQKWPWFYCQSVKSNLWKRIVNGLSVLVCAWVYKCMNSIYYIYVYAYIAYKYVYGFLCIAISRWLRMAFHWYDLAMRAIYRQVGRVSDLIYVIKIK